MKRARRSRRRTGRLGADFARGLVATGLLAAVQGRAARPGGRRERRRVLRLALQGGVALAAGAAAAEAANRRDWSRAAAAVAVGALGALALEQLLNDETDKEIHDGQEKG